MSFYRGQGTLIHKNGTEIIVKGTDFVEEYPNIYEVWGNNPLKLLKRFRKSSIVWWLPTRNSTLCPKCKAIGWHRDGCPDAYPHQPLSAKVGANEG